MGFSIADLFRVALLILNAMAIVSEKRVLEPHGLAGNAVAAGDAPVSGGKEGLGQVLKSVRMLFRGPLVILNAVTIVFTIIFG